MSDELIGKIPVPINFRLLGRLPSVYAHHMAIQQGPDEVVLSFFEIIQPFVNQASSEDIERLKKSGVTAECVSKVIVSKRQFHEFTALMNKISDEMKSKESQE